MTHQHRPTARRPLLHQPRALLTLLLGVVLLSGMASPSLAQRNSQETGEQEIHPALQAIEDINPTTPKDLVWALKILLDMSEYPAANQYGAKLLALNLNDQAKLALIEEYGSPLFFRMTGIEELQPELHQFALEVLEVGHQSVTNVERLNRLVNQLDDPQVSVRFHAILDLKEGGVASIAPLLKALADPQRASLHEEARGTLTELGQVAVEPMIASLRSPQPAVVASAVEVLGNLGAERAIPYLIRPLVDPDSPAELRSAAETTFGQLVGGVPTSEEATRYLEDRALVYYQGVSPLAGNHLDEVELWQWDTQTNQPVPVKLQTSDASLMVAVELATDLHHLRPEQEDYHRLFLSAQLEAEKLTHGYGTPLETGPGTIHDQAVAAGVPLLLSVLQEALSQNRPVAAMAALEVLGNQGTAEVLASSHGRPGLVASALRHPDRRVRFFAAKAIMTISPETAYAGSSHLIEALDYFIRTADQRRALIAMPRNVDAQSFVGMLTEMGYVADAVTSSQVAIARATSEPDYEFLLLSEGLFGPSTHEALHQLRQDPRTATLPIGLLASDEVLPPSERLADLDPLTKAYARPFNAEGLGSIVQQTLRLSPRQHVDQQERIAQARQSLLWLKMIAEDRSRHRYYRLLGMEDSLIGAMQVAPLTESATELLALLGTPAAQTALVDFVSQHARSIEQRRMAVEAFEQAVERRGILLTTDQILLQYTRYNQSEHLTTQTQQVLGAVLDAIERPTANEATSHQGEGEVAN